MLNHYIIINNDNNMVQYCTGPIMGNWVYCERNSHLFPFLL